MRDLKDVSTSELLRELRDRNVVHKLPVHSLTDPIKVERLGDELPNYVQYTHDNQAAMIGRTLLKQGHLDTYWRRSLDDVVMGERMWLATTVCTFVNTYLDNTLPED